MATKLDYINELEKRHGSSAELNELRSRYTPDIYSGMTDQKEIQQKSGEIYDLSTGTFLPRPMAENIYGPLKELGQVDSFKKNFNAVINGEGQGELPKPKFPGQTPRDIRVSRLVGEKEEDGRPSLLKRTVKSFGRSFVNLFATLRTKSDVGIINTDLTVLFDRMELAKDAGLMPKDGGIKDYLAIDFKERDELFGGETMLEHRARVSAKKVIETPGFKATATPEAITIPEKAADVVGNVSAFVAKLAITKKLLGAPAAGRNITAWETLNLAEGGIPGTGAGMYVALRGIDKIPIKGAKGFFVKTGSQSALFAGVTAVEGGDQEAIATAALLPWALRAFDAATAGTAKLVRGRLEAKAVKNLRDMGNRNGIDLSKVPDSSLKFVISKSRQARFWNKQFDKGKITEETLNTRLDQIRQDVAPVLSGIAKQQPIKPVGKDIVKAKPTAKKPAPEPSVKPPVEPVKPAKVIRQPKVTTKPPVAVSAAQFAREHGITGKPNKAQQKNLDALKQFPEADVVEGTTLVRMINPKGAAFKVPAGQIQAKLDAGFTLAPKVVIAVKREAFETSDLATSPNISESQIQAQKQADGKFKLFFRGTRNEIFQGELFNSASEARQFFKVQKIKAQEAFAQPPIEPEITTEVPPQLERLGGKEAGATTIIPDVATEVTETGKRLGSTLAAAAKGVKEIFSRNVKRFSDHVKGLGARGEQIARDFDEITQRTQKRVNNSILDAKEALKGVSKENRVKIAKAMNRRLENVPKWIQERANKLSAVMDEIMNEARSIGIQRRVGGEKVELRGSGKAFPQVPNAEGDKFLKLAGNKGLTSPRVLQVAQKAVADGLAGSVEEYVAGLQQFRANQLRGVSSYLERTRVELPEEFIEWDPDRVLDALIQKTWLTVEGTRQWGTDKGGLSFPKLAVQVEGVRQDSGPDEAKQIEQFVKAAFGQELLSTEASRKISGAVRGFQFLTKIAPSALTIMRNMLDRFAKAAAIAPASVILKSTLQFPPIINAFMPSARKIEEEMIRRGAVFSNTSLGEGYQPGHLATKIAGKAFAASERGNQIFIALVRKNAIDHNLRILNTNPKIAAIFDKRIGKLLSPLEAIGRSPTQAQKRLRDLGDDELIAKLESVDDIPPDILDAVLHRTVRDKAFPVVLSTKRSWWDNKPFMRMITQFKVWGTDQVGHIWNDVVKDSVQNRDPSKMVRWLVMMAMMGELYNIIRDFVLGRDESLVATLTAKERRNLKEISTTILKDLLDGGAVGILADVIYGLPNLVGGPTLQTMKSLGEATVKSIWNPSQAKDAIAQMAKKETPALKQAQSLLDKVDAQFQKKNITQDYYKVRLQGFRWANDKKFPTAKDKAKRLAVQSVLGWIKNVPQERTFSYEMAIRQIIVGDIEDASEHLFFLLKTAKTDEELMSLEKGIESALNNASPLGKVAERDSEGFLRGMSRDQRQTVTSTQLQYDRNASEAYGLAIRKFAKWRRSQ